LVRLASAASYGIGLSVPVLEHAVHWFRSKAATDSDDPEKVDAMRRNGRSACSGTSGRHASESMVGMARIMHLNMDLALAAAKIEVELHLPMADSVILSTARQCEAMLWTRDADFEDIQGVRYVANTL